MIRRIASFSLVALLPVLAHADPAPDYATHCAVCHGDDRLGGTGPALIPETLGRLKGIDQVIAKGRVSTQMVGYEAELSPDEILQLIDDFARCAPLAREAGYDGVEEMG